MGQVPDGDDAHLMRPRRQRGHVVPPPGAIVDLREHQDAHLLGQRGLDLLGRDDPQAPVPSEMLQEPLRHVDVGREIAAVGQHHLSVGHRHGGRKRLKQPYRERIAHGGVTRPRADEPPDAVAQRVGQSHPVGPVPAADRHPAPLVLQDAAHGGLGAKGQGAQRIAVEIDLPIRQHEARARRVEIGHALVSKMSRAPPSSFHKYALPERRWTEALRHRTGNRRRH